MAATPQLSLFSGAPKPRPVEDCPRHRGNENSIAANVAISESGKKDDQRKKLFTLISGNKDGLCIHKLKELTGWAANEFSGRLTKMSEPAETQYSIVEAGNCRDAWGHKHRAAIYKVRK